MKKHKNAPTPKSMLVNGYNRFLLLVTMGGFLLAANLGFAAAGLSFSGTVEFAGSGTGISGVTVTGYKNSTLTTVDSTTTTAANGTFSLTLSKGTTDYVVVTPPTGTNASGVTLGTIPSGGAISKVSNTEIQVTSSSSGGTSSGSVFSLQKLLTITASAQSKTYGQTVTFGSGSTLFTTSGLKTGDTIGTVTLAVSGSGGAATASVSGSPYTITPSAATGGTFNASDYSITYSTGQLTVGVATVTPTVTLNNKVYNGTTGATTIATRSLGGVLNSDDVNLGTSGTVAAFGNKNVNSYSGISITGLSLTGTTAGNYQLSSTSTTASANITAATVTPTVALNNMVYNGTTGPTTIATRSLTGIVGSDDVNLGTSGTVAAFGSKNVNSYSGISITGLSLSGTTAANYQLSSTATTASANITAATVTPVITLSNMVYNGTTGPTTIATWALTGVVGSDDVNLGASGTVAAFSSKNVNSYSGISITGLSLTGTTAGNYQLSSTSTTASANITARTLNVTATGVDKVYDGTTNATVTLSDDHLISDDVTNTYTTAFFDTPGVGSNINVTVSGITNSGADSADYVLASTTVSTTANITIASLTGVVSSSENPALPGDSVTLSNVFTVVTPGGGTPTGDVQFVVDGSDFSSPVALDDTGTATLTITNLTHGTHTVSVEYVGDGNFIGSTNSLAGTELINTPPVAGGETLGTYENNAVNLSVIKLLLNASDADGDPVSLLSNDSTSAQGGTVLVSGDTLTYTPPTGYSGTDTFNYVVTDTYGATNSGTVAVTVYSPTNQPERVVSMQTLPDGNQGITFAGIPGFTYVVQATPSLSPSSWTPVFTNTADVNGLFIFDDLNATNFPTRYYRSVSQ